MTKAYCKTCGSWENIHRDGLCHVCHYGQEEGYAFPVAATPEAVARAGGLTATLVDVEFAAATGPYADTRQREADESVARAEAEPILGKLTAPEQQEGGSLNRVSPVGADAEDRREASNRALPAEVEAMSANVEGLKRDVRELREPLKVSDIDAKQAGDGDLKGKLSKTIAKERKATDKQAGQKREERQALEEGARSEEERVVLANRTVVQKQ